MKPETRKRIQQTAAVVGGLIVVVVIVWLDIATGIWQELVILSGLAAGLVTFILTVVVMGHVFEKRTARRWAPINRLAITEFLHAIVDDDRSEIAHGKFVPRSLTLPTALLGPGGSALSSEMNSELALLREQVVAERTALSDALSRWTGFLASSGDNEGVLRHIASIALHLDLVRDSSMSFEANRTEASLASLRDTVAASNEHSSALVTELRARLAQG